MVRTRSDEKRREIIRVAAKAFQELGYERTSMLTIAERMRGSKQTLYNYFPSKEDLLRAVLDFDVGEIADQAMDEFLAEKSLRKGLTRTREDLPGAPACAAGDLEHANRRHPAGRVRASARTSTRTSCASAWKRVADAFKALMVEGKLRRADPWLAAMHFKGLMLQDLLERQLLNAAKQGIRRKVETAVKHAADAFLRIYGNDEPRRGKARGQPRSTCIRIARARSSTWQRAPARRANSRKSLVR